MRDAVLVQEAEGLEDFNGKESSFFGPTAGTPSSPLFQLNHWIEALPVSPRKHRALGDYSGRMTRADECKRERSLQPALVAVNWYDLGDLLVVNVLNGIRPTPSRACRRAELSRRGSQQRPTPSTSMTRATSPTGCAMPELQPRAGAARLVRRSSRTPLESMKRRSVRSSVSALPSRWNSRRA